MRHQGQIAEWYDERGYGFVRPQGNTERVFVHISAFPIGGRRPSVGELISYAPSQDDRGRPRATEVTYIVGRPLARERRSPAPIIAAVTVANFLAFVAMSVEVGALPRWVLGLYVLASVATYVAYANDKRAAQTGRWRTEEKTLLLLGLAGGWPGALIAQHQFRHKTKKFTFQAAFWLTVGLNCAGLAMLRQAGVEDVLGAVFAVFQRLAP